LSAPRWSVIDFETAGIEQRPIYPPKPTGCAIKRAGTRLYKYWSWGHPTQNNCTEKEGHAAVREEFNGSNPLLFQEAKFDTDVAVEWVPGVKMPPWERIHDTKYMIFMHSPHAPSLSLKPSAERILGMPPEEQDELKAWIMKNVPGAKLSNWGAFICLAPGRLVGKYAIGDIVRTDKLGVHLWKYLEDTEQIDAYNRERHLMPILLENEQEGIRVDLPGLKNDVPLFRQSIEVADQWLRKTLKVPNLNVDSDAEFASALISSGVVPEERFTRTPTGKPSTSKKNLTPDLFNNKKVFQTFSYRNKLSTCVGTFAEPWLLTAETTKGLVHTSWRQVKADSGGNSGDGGARSGRMQSTPNFQNIPKNFNKKDQHYSHPAHLKVPELPLMRKYFLPDDNKSVWGRRDYNQQELRILAHFEDGSLLRHYLEDPRYDMHALVQNGLRDMLGREFARDRVKAFNFQDIYGGGIPAFCASLDCDIDTARAVKEAKRALMPDVDALEKDIRARGKQGMSIRTWGGREYYCEPAAYSPKFGRHMTFEYKLLNYLIQGSAADCTKEALIRYHDHPKREGRMLVAVHDEINISVPKKRFAEEMQLLREVMQSVEFDVPMLSDGEFGPNWGSLEKFKDKVVK
jgi:DNA polymerase I-like protein with 3'-5' exonuclease and polymerase domains